MCIYARETFCVPVSVYYSAQIYVYYFVMEAALDLSVLIYIKQNVFFFALLLFFHNVIIFSTKFKT